MVDVVFSSVGLMFATDHFQWAEYDATINIFTRKHHSTMWHLRIDEPSEEQFNAIIEWLRSTYPHSVMGDEACWRRDEQFYWAVNLGATRTVDFHYNAHTLEVQVPPRSKEFRMSQFNYFAEFAFGEIVAVEFKLRFMS